MEEIRKVARAYYNGADEEERKLAQKLFKTLDEDGDGRVSLKEYKKRVNPLFSNANIFKQLDQNGDGTLDFDEVLALYYMDKVSIPRCGSCHNLLLASYFCCMSCLRENTPHYLCCGCYAGGKFQHRHSSGEFSDTRAMLKLLSRLVAGDEDDDGVIHGFKHEASKKMVRNIVNSSAAEESVSYLAQTATEKVTSSVAEVFEDVELGCRIL